MNRATGAYFAAALVAAGVAGAALDRYGLAQAMVVTVAVVAVASLGVARAERNPEPVEDWSVERSRVVHYARMSKVEDSSRLVGVAGNAFEEALLKRGKWTGMPGPELERLSQEAPESMQADTPPDRTPSAGLPNSLFDE